MKKRYEMTGRGGEFVSFDTREEAAAFRLKNKKQFSAVRIHEATQVWAAIVVAGRVYPKEVETPREFRVYNVKIEDKNNER